MSSSNSGNGILITMVFFIILTLGLGVGEYFAAKSLRQAKTDEDTALEEYKSVSQHNTKLKEVSQRFRNVLGTGYANDLFSKNLIEDLDTLIKSLSKEEVIDGESQTLWYRITGSSEAVPQTYQALITALVNYLEQKHLSAEEAVNQRSDYTQNALAQEELSITQTGDFETSIDKLAEESKTQLKEANTRYNELNEQNLQLLADIEKTKTESDQANEQKREQLANDKKEVEDIVKINEDLRDKLEQLTNPFFDVPDGKIVYVDQADHVVRLNIGSADGVRLLTTFGVFSHDTFEKGEIHPKGSLQIIQIVSEHESDARILEDALNDPFAPGDMIYTPLWKSGSEVNIALDYFLDVDGDNKDDLDLLINIIKASGANIVAWIDKSGIVHGTLSSDVTYLIQGNSTIGEALEADPDLSPELKEKIAVTHKLFNEEAKRYSIRSMKLNEFLRRIHYNQNVDAPLYQETGSIGPGIPIISDAPEGSVSSETNERSQQTPDSESNDSQFRKRTPKEP